MLRHPSRRCFRILQIRAFSLFWGERKRFFEWWWCTGDDSVFFRWCCMLPFLPFFLRCLWSTVLIISLVSAYHLQGLGLFPVLSPLLSVSSFFLHRISFHRLIKWVVEGLIALLCELGSNWTCLARGNVGLEILFWELVLLSRNVSNHVINVFIFEVIGSELLRSFRLTYHFLSIDYNRT